MKFNYTINRSQVYDLARESVFVNDWLKHRRQIHLCLAACLGILVALGTRTNGVSLLDIFYNEAEHSVNIFLVLFGATLGFVIAAGLLYVFLYAIPLQIAFGKLHKDIMKDGNVDVDYELTIGNDSISNEEKRGRLTVFFNEFDQVISGKVGYHLVSSANKEVKLCIYKSAVDYATLQSLLPSHITYRVLP